MKGVEPLIRSVSLDGLAPLLKSRYGVSLQDLLGETGIDLGPIEDPASHISMRRYAALLELAAERVREDCFGLEFAQAFPRGAAGVVAYLFFNAPDLRTCVACISRFTRLHMDALEFAFSEAEGLAHLTWSYDGSLLGPRKQLTEFLMALCIHRFRGLLGDEWTPLSAEFEYRQPDCLERYHALFGPHLMFDAGHNRLIIRGNVLAHRSKSADKRLFELLKAVAEKELAQHADATDLLAQLGEKIVEQLPLDGIDLERVATAMGLSSRQLQGRLRRRATSFEAELGNVRRRMADRYLRETDMSMTDIALMLGFSELSSFTRAVRGWFGMPPTSYREQARRPAHEP